MNYDEIIETPQDEMRREILNHSSPHTQRCCGVVAQIPFWEAQKLYIESKLKKSLSRFNNIKI